MTNNKTDLINTETSVHKPNRALVCESHFVQILQKPKLILKRNPNCQFPFLNFQVPIPKCQF